MKYSKFIAVLLLLLLASLPALETTISTDEKNPSAAIYSVKQPEKYRQLSFKCTAVNLLVSSDNRNKIEIVFFSQERKSSNKAVNYFDDFRKGKASLKESNETAIQNIVTAAISEKERNIIFDVTTDNKKSDLYALILLPAGYGVQTDIKAGNVSVESMASELSLNIVAGNVTLQNSRGVASINNKAGNVEVKNFQGVMTANLLSGNIEINKSEGSLAVKMSTGNCEINDFSGKISVSNKVGNLDVKNINKSDIQIKNFSGNVDIENLQDCGIVKINNETGEISMQNSRMKRLIIDATGGDIDLKNVEAAYNINSRAGDITISTPTLNLAEENKIDLDFGDIELNLKDRSNYLFLKNETGEKQFNAEQEIEADDYLRIKRKSGQTKQFIINIGVGSITVK